MLKIWASDHIQILEPTESFAALQPTWYQWPQPSQTTFPIFVTLPGDIIQDTLQSCKKELISESLQTIYKNSEIVTEE